jgi:hypothetical protein
VRAGTVQKYGTASNEFPPAPGGVPFVSFDEGKTSPRFFRPTVMNAPLN